MNLLSEFLTTNGEEVILVPKSSLWEGKGVGEGGTGQNLILIMYIRYRNQNIAFPCWHQCRAGKTSQLMFLESFCIYNGKYLCVLM